MDNIYKIPFENVDEFEARIEKLNKKAKKLNCDLIKLEKTQVIKEKDKKQNLIVYQEYKLTGNEPKLNGYKIISKLEKNKEQNLIYNFTDEKTPEQYKTASTYCDHCKTNRQRKHLFIVKDETSSEYYQIGKTCLKDFTGHGNPEHIAQYMEMIKDLEGIEEEYNESIKLERELKYFDLIDFLTMTALVIDKNGWRASGMGVYEGKQPTNLHVYDLLRYPDNKDNEEFKKQLTNEHKETAINCIKWFTTQDTSNDYFYNCNVIIKEEIVTVNTKGIAASMIHVYLKAQEKAIIKEVKEKAEKKIINSQYVGNIGDKIETNVTLTNKHSFDSMYGTKYILNFIDSNGNVFVWFTTTYQDIEQSEQITIKGTIKDHNEYKDIKQNILTRCKIRKIEKKTA